MSASPNTSPLLHSINDTRSLLNCGRNSVYNLVNSNELTLIKMGRRSLITDDSIRAYIDRKVEEARNRTSLDNDPNCIKARAARSNAVAGTNMQAKRNPMGSGSSITEISRHNRDKGKRSCLTETL
jgi:excisionase family DNA binding protein